MAGPKTLPFNRVRVMVVLQDGACPLPDKRRLLPEPRRALERPWRDPGLHKAAGTPAVVHRAAAQPAMATAPADGTELQPASQDGTTAASASAQDPTRLPGEVQNDSPGERPDAGPASESGVESNREPRVEGLRGRPSPGRDPAETMTRTGSPLSAVARAVEEVAVVRALAEVLVETCSGDAWRDTGPWEFSLQLQALGLGQSSLELHLSRDLLSLRFRCDTLATAHLLSRHRDTLLALLQQQLHPQLAIEIAIVDA